MADKASRRGAASLGVPMMILAFVAVGVFLYWLSIRSAKEKAVEIHEDSVALAANAAANTAIPGATIVSPDTLQSRPGFYDNQLVQVSGLNVEGQLGKQGFWLKLPNGSHFLVALTPSLIQQGDSVATGQAPLVDGTLRPLADSVIARWIGAGTINSADSAAAAAASYFIEARVITTKAKSGS